MATAGNGLAAVLYSPSVVKAKVGDGTEVTVTESTDYPFDGKIQFDRRVAKRRDVSAGVACPGVVAGTDCRVEREALGGAAVVGEAGWL